MPVAGSRLPRLDASGPQDQSPTLEQKPWLHSEEQSRARWEGRGEDKQETRNLQALNQKTVQASPMKLRSGLRLGHRRQCLLGPRQVKPDTRPHGLTAVAICKSIQQINGLRLEGEKIKTFNFLLSTQQKEQPHYVLHAPFHGKWEKPRERRGPAGLRSWGPGRGTQSPSSHI